MLQLHCVAIIIFMSLVSNVAAKYIAVIVPETNK